MRGMYIIAIGWMWVVLLMAITESNFVAGVLTFVFYGLLPCSLLMWLLGTPMRRARRRALEAAEYTDATESAEPEAIAEQPPEKRD